MIYTPPPPPTRCADAAKAALMQVAAALDAYAAVLGEALDGYAEALAQAREARAAALEAFEALARLDALDAKAKG